MKTSVLLIAAVLTVPLGACTGTDYVTDEGKPSPHLGESVNNNIAAQIANPEAPVADQTQTMQGERAALAQDRYSKGKVIEPTDVNTSEVGGGSSSSGGSGSK